MKSYILFWIVILSTFSFAQQTSFDRLELFYSQKNYKKAYKFAGKLLNNPNLDAFAEPLFFRALSAFHLADELRWTKKHPNTFQEAQDLYVEFLNTSSETQQENLKLLPYTNDLIIYLKGKLSQLELSGKTNEMESVRTFLLKIGVDFGANEGKVTEKASPIFHFDVKNRDELLVFAQQQLDVPYLYGGDSPVGFDCSGFVKYVYSAYNIEIPRRSEDQYKQAKKIDRKDAKKGDLVFFDSGRGVNHVGIVVSAKGEPLKMIHASTTSGIVFTEVDSSSYWKSKIKGFGTFF